MHPGHTLARQRQAGGRVGASDEALPIAANVGEVEILFTRQAVEAAAADFQRTAGAHRRRIEAEQRRHHGEVVGMAPRAGLRRVRDGVVLRGKVAAAGFIAFTRHAPDVACGKTAGAAAAVRAPSRWRIDVRRGGSPRRGLRFGVSRRT